MREEDCFYLGYFSKVIGTKGEVALNLDVDNPENYLELKSLMVKINERDQILVPFFIVSIQPHSKNTVRISLKNLTDAVGAKKLIGKSVFLPIGMLPSLSEKQFYFHEIIGFNAIDKQVGEIGRIKDVLEHPAQQLLVIENKSGQEILIPIIDEFIEKVDRSGKTLYLKCPEGLIDLYTGEDG